MAGDWIKMRCGLDADPKTLWIAHNLDRSAGEIVAMLYTVSSWFARHGVYGKLREDRSVIDSFLRVEGFSEQLVSEGWLSIHDGVLCLRGLCDVSSARKSLGRAVRKQVLSGAKCAACGKPDGLVIDHIIPVVRGGSCETSNLQALCQPCNARKGRKTMAEFMAEGAQ